MQTEETSKLDLSSLAGLDLTPAWAKKDAGITVGKSKGEAPRKQFDRDRPARKPDGGKFRDRKPRFEERVPRLDAELKVIPETKALGEMIHRLQGDFHAFKLKDLAYFLLDNPKYVSIHVAPKRPAQGEQPKPLGFLQCKACSFAATSEAEVAAHAVAAHLGDYYDSKEIDCEPPKGNFSCVAKCGLSGVLLGPPNIHEYNSIVREMIRTRYPDMSEEEYRSRIVMVKEPEAIEEWRKSAVKKTVFIRKGAGEGAVELTREQAEGEFKRTILPALVETPKKQFVITAEAALKSPSKALQRAVREALEFERRSPFSMCFALRGALHHRKMFFFRTNDSRGQEFVMGIEPKPFDAEHAIPELAKIARFIEENPCSKKAEIAPDPESEKHLAWLVSTGHVIAFTNGVYSAVEKFPKYGPQWLKKRTPKVEEPKVEEVKAEEPKAEEAKIEEVKVEENEGSAKLAE